MSDSHEPSYYEIALTNRQVLVAFVVLLVCMLGAFFSGVWVGRGARPQPPVQATAPPKDTPLEEYAFFSESPKKRAGGEVRAEAEPPAKPQPPAAVPPAETPTPKGTTLLSDMGAKTATPSAGPETMGEAGEPPAGSPEAAPEDTAQTPATAPAAPPAPAPSQPSKPSAATPATPAAAAPTLAPNEMVVQVFSSTDLAQAHSIMERLKKNGYNAFLSPVVVGTQTMQRVRIGPYNDRARAQRVADDVRKKFRLETWITR